MALTGNVLSANDTDPDDVTLTASFVSASPGADVTVNADGSFVYVPPAGLTSTTDTFTYRVTDGDGLFDDGTVQIAIGADIVWYVNASAVAGGDGRSTEPFDTLAPLRGAGDARCRGGDPLPLRRLVQRRPAARSGPGPDRRSGRPDRGRPRPGPGDRHQAIDHQRLG